MSKHQNDWNEHIPKFLLSYRSAVHDSTCRSPAKVIFGTEIKLTGDLKFGVKPATEGDLTYTGKENSLNELHEFVRTRIKIVSDRMKARSVQQTRKAVMRDNWFYSTTHSGRRVYLKIYKPPGMDRIKLLNG